MTGRHRILIFRWLVRALGFQGQSTRAGGEAVPPVCKDSRPSASKLPSQARPPGLRPDLETELFLFSPTAIGHLPLPTLYEHRVVEEAAAPPRQPWAGATWAGQPQAAAFTHTLKGKPCFPGQLRDPGTLTGGGTGKGWLPSACGVTDRVPGPGPGGKGGCQGVAELRPSMLGTQMQGGLKGVGWRDLSPPTTSNAPPWQCTPDILNLPQKCYSSCLPPAETGDGHLVLPGGNPLVPVPSSSDWDTIQRDRAGAGRPRGWFPRVSGRAAGRGERQAG